MAGFAVPNTFSDDTKALATPVNANFAAIAAVISPGSNGGVAPVAAGAILVPHGLPYTPTQWWAVLSCTSADAGYSANDKVYVGTPREIAIFNIDATNLNGIYNSVANLLSIPHKTTGVLTAITNTKWVVFYYAR